MAAVPSGTSLDSTPPTIRKLKKKQSLVNSLDYSLYEISMVSGLPVRKLKKRNEPEWKRNICNKRRDISRNKIYSKASSNFSYLETGKTGTFYFD
jgi:hypothetical protein